MSFPKAKPPHNVRVLLGWLRAYASEHGQTDCAAVREVLRIHPFVDGNLRAAYVTLQAALLCIHQGLAEVRVWRYLVCTIPRRPSGLAGFPLSWGGSLRVAVFIDWMNIYKAARVAFGLEEESGVRGQIDPFRVGCVLAAANKRGNAAELVRVEVHRGRPLPNQDSIGLKDPDAVETASWYSEGYRRRIPPIEGVTNHTLREKIFLAIEDRTHYGRAARRRIEARASAPASI